MTPRQGPNRRAAAQTVKALRGAGRLELVDSARVTGFFALATAVDLDMFNASLWREYRAAEVTLRGPDDDDDGILKEWLESLSAEVGDEAQSGAPVPRSSGGRRR